MGVSGYGNPLGVVSENYLKGSGWDLMTVEETDFFRKWKAEDDEDIHIKYQPDKKDRNYKLGEDRKLYLKNYTDFLAGSRSATGREWEKQIYINIVSEDKKVTEESISVPLSSIHCRTGKD